MDKSIDESSSAYGNTFKTILIQMDKGLDSLTQVSLEGDGEQERLNSSFKSARDFLVDALSKELALEDIRIDNRTNSHNTVDLIKAALNTAHMAGMVINSFFRETEYKPQGEEEIYNAIKPLVRDILQFNILLNTLTITFGAIEDTDSLTWLDGQIVIKTPSYLATAKELSDYFRAESNIKEFQLTTEQLIGQNNGSRARHYIVEHIARCIVSNPLADANRFLDLIKSASEDNISLDKFVTTDERVIGKVYSEIETILMMSTYSISSSGAETYLKLAYAIQNNLDALLIESDLKKELIRMDQSKSFFPTIFNVNSLTVTRGCPAYFHNLALRYISKVLYLYYSNR